MFSLALFSSFPSKRLLAGMGVVLAERKGDERDAEVSIKQTGWQPQGTATNVTTQLQLHPLSACVVMAALASCPPVSAS